MKNRQNKKNVIISRRALRVRAAIKSRKLRPRLAVFRSLKHISAQIIDDRAGRTLAAASDSKMSKSLKGLERAAAVGKLVAEMAARLGVKEVVFDRRHYKYHGKVKALAEAARQFGLSF